MWFVDHATITVKAGDGGRGCSAFAQPPYTRAPHPDGGNGGGGGDIIIRTNPQTATLLDFHFQHEFKAPHGGHGGGSNKTGKRGEDRVIRVPVGTVIHDAQTHEVLRDLTRPDEDVIIARGGRGGRGNVTITEAQPGEPGEQRRLILELRLIADVGIIGFPNAGKSSLLARISTARPKVGAYPFTTRYPVLGVVRLDEERSFVACDLPGLIEGAHHGKGLGMQFLRHTERTRVLIHLVDLAGLDGRDPGVAHRHLNEELAAYNPALTRRPQVLAANKMDLPQAQASLESFRERVGQPVIPVSCATGAGMPELLEAVWRQLQACAAGDDDG